MKVAELEHNRWLAASYLFSKYSRMSKSSYFSSSNYNKNKERFDSRDKNDTVHICMTTNKGLKELYGKLTDKTRVGPKQKEGEDIKLVFRNDIEQLKEGLKYYQIKKDESNKQ